MVRIIAGTLLYVGIGRIKESDIPGIIKAGTGKKRYYRRPMGLYLAKVCYGDGGVLWDE